MLETGDIVQLQSGSPPLTVAYTVTNAAGEITSVSCCWWCEKDYIVKWIDVPPKTLSFCSHPKI